MTQAEAREISAIPADVISSSHSRPVANDVELSEQSDRIWEVYDDEGVLLYTGISLDGSSVYLWLYPTVEFERRPLAGLRAAKHWLNHYMTREYPNVWVMVDPKVQGAQRIAELAGFKLSGIVYNGVAGLNRIYRRRV